MDMEGLAASRMEERMHMYLARCEGPDGQMKVNEYDQYGKYVQYAILKIV